MLRGDLTKEYVDHCINKCAQSYLKTMAVVNHYDAECAELRNPVEPVATDPMIAIAVRHSNMAFRIINLEEQLANVRLTVDQVEAISVPHRHGSA